MIDYNNIGRKNGIEAGGCVAVLLAAIFIGVVIAIHSAWSGFAFSLLWGWFAVPLGAAPITVPHAIGLAVMVGMFTSRKKTKEEGLGDILLALFLWPLFAIIFGSIAHAFM